MPRDLRGCVDEGRNILYLYSSSLRIGGEIVLDPKAFDHHANKEAIRSASHNEVVVALCAWFDSWLGVSYIDTEYIEYAGSDVARARNKQEVFDTIVLGWVKKESDISGERYIIAASFLSGYWAMGVDAGISPSSSCIAELKDFLKTSLGSAAMDHVAWTLVRCLHKDKGLSLEVREEIRSLLIRYHDVIKQEPRYYHSADYLGRCIRSTCWDFSDEGKIWREKYERGETQC